MVEPELIGDSVVSASYFAKSFAVSTVSTMLSFPDKLSRTKDLKLGPPRARITPCH